MKTKDTELDKLSRAERFTYLQNNKPKPGDVLKSRRGQYAKVMIDKTKGEVNMYTTCVINSDATGWVLSLESYGLKVMIDRIDHELLRERCQDKLQIRAILVTRLNDKKTALVGRLLEDESNI